MTDLRSTSRHSRESLPIGTVRWRLRKGSNGERHKVALIKVPHSNGSGSWVNYARYLYEQHKGPVPPGMVVVHKDGDSANNSLDNLVLWPGKNAPKKGPFLPPAEIEDLLRKHERMVWWIARRVMGPCAARVDVEDCAAVVRLQFVAAARAYDPSRGLSFRTMAVKLARIYAYRWKNAHHNRGIYVPRHLNGRSGLAVTSLNSIIDHDGELTGAGLIASQEPEPVFEVPAAELWAKLARVLTARQLEAVRLRFVDGLEYLAIGQRLGCSVSNVRWLIVTSLQRLKRMLPELEQYLE